MSKNIIILIGILVIIGIGYLTYQYLPTPTSEKEKDEIVTLLEELERETGIDFSEIQPVEFKWVVKVDPEVKGQDIEGKGFEVRGISTEQETKVEEFLNNKGFEKDLYNIADGTVVGLVGYKKDQIVCTVISGASGYKEATGQWVPPDWNKRDVDVKCGKGSGLVEPLVSTEEAIKKLFAEKYKTKVGAVIIEISKETENHVRGTIQILDPLAEGGAGDRGIFLAARVNGNWELVEEVEKYNFPEDVIIETKNGDNFFVILASNPTTGFQWEIDFDSSYIQLVDRKYVSRSQEPTPVLGAGGDETFHFLALKSGETEMTFSYLRPWEDKEPIERKVYEIIIE